MKYTVEVCTYTIEDVAAAQKAGAPGVELCADPYAGGRTPSYGHGKHVVETLDIDVTGDPLNFVHESVGIKG